MAIRAVIFDLDGTLYEQEQIRDTAREQSVRVMIEAGLRCSVEEGCRKLEELTPRTHSVERYRELIRYFGCYDDVVAEVGRQKYLNYDFDKLDAYPEARDVLVKLRENGFKLMIVTEGSYAQQHKKIDVLGIRSYFDEIHVTEGDKTEILKEIVGRGGFGAEEVLIVGDRAEKEISVGNKLGMKAVRLLKGAYKDQIPGNDLERADFEINDLREVLKIVEGINGLDNCKVEKKKNLKIVTIGGGTGTSALLEGLKEYTDDITTIVTVTDSGRSTGMIRRELDMPAPGDARNCLLALANSEKRLYDLFQYRFDEGSFEGYSFGNIFIAALTKLTGSFEKAIEEASRILNLKGNVLPATFDNVNICAELEDGNVLEEEDKIIDRHNDYVYLRPKIRRVFHRPEGKVNERALQKIKEADLIIISPGSLFTSVISNLVVKGVPEAINESCAKKVYVCNIMTQVSQTYEFKASDHVRKILDYLSVGDSAGRLDFVVLNNGRPSDSLLDSYKKEKAFLVENDCEAVRSLGVRVLLGDFLDDVDEKKLLWEKKDLLRHNPSRIAEVLVGLVG